MSVYYPASNCGGGAIPQYSCNPCPEYEYSRIRSIAFVKNTFSFTDPSDPTEWNTGLGNGDIIVIWATSGTYDGSTIEELVGFGVSGADIGGTFRGGMLDVPDRLGNDCRWILGTLDLRLGSLRRLPFLDLPRGLCFSDARQWLPFTQIFAPEKAKYLAEEVRK